MNESLVSSSLPWVWRDGWCRGQVKASLSTKLKVATWNVWFDRFEREERTRATIDALGASGADVIALQEVTPSFLLQFLSTDWVRQGWVSHGFPDSVEPYATVLWGRRPARVFIEDLPSEKGRQLCAAEIGSGVVATAHLESQRDNHAKRGEQLIAIQTTLSRYSWAVWLGDFNFDPSWPHESGRIDAGYVDAWEKKGEGAGATVDTARNGMALAHKGAPRDVRYDRVYARNAKVRRTELVGTEAIAVGVWCSDHFGVVAELDVPKSA